MVRATASPKVQHALKVTLIPKPPQAASIVGVKSDLGKALIASNSGSIIKINPL